MPRKKKENPKSEEFQRFESFARRMVSIKPDPAPGTEFDGYLASGASPDETGLPWQVWISLSPESAGPEDLRIWLGHPSSPVLVTLIPEVRVPPSFPITPEEEDSLVRWIDLNREVIEKHWSWEFLGSLEVLKALRHL